MKKILFLIAILLCVNANAVDYYIDFTNGIDTAYGGKQGNFTADAGTDTTTIVDTELNGLTITDNAASSGDYVYNVTRSAGSYVDSWDDGTDTIVLTDVITGQTTGDTYYILSSWKTINQYTTTTSRTAGDNAYVRANMTLTQNSTSIIFDEDGTAVSPISILGCNSTTRDPWVDGSNIRPIIDFDNSNYGMIFNTDNYWYLDGLDITQSSIVDGQLESYNSIIEVNDCIIRESDTGTPLVKVDNGGRVLFNNCTINDAQNSYCVLVSQGVARLNNCIINAGTITGSSCAITVQSSSCAYLNNCTIGSDAVSFETNTFYCSGNCYMRNVTYGITPTYATSYATIQDSFMGIFSEDDDGVYGAQKQWMVAGNIEKATASPRSGGSSSYATMTSNTSCSSAIPLILGNESSGFSAVWLTKDVEKTITVYARTGTAWDSALTSSDAYLRTSYLSNGSTAARTEIQSTETITNDGNWTAFTATFTPLQTGFAYFWFYLEKYDADEYIDVDIKPTVN